MFLYGEEGILMVESPNVFSDMHSKNILLNLNEAFIYRFESYTIPTEWLAELADAKIKQRVMK